MKRLTAFVVCLALAWGGSASAASVPAQDPEVLDVTVTSPWLALLVNFIGGVNVKTTSVREWNDSGELVSRFRARNLQALPPETRILALDRRDAKSVGLPYERYPNYRQLYDTLPLDPGKIDVFLSDPSVISFVAQRVLTALSYWDPDNYRYYQRRLAEFQARLYSTTLAGRQALKDQPVYDLTGHSASLLQAAGCKLTHPTPAELAAWSSWKEMSQLTGLVARLVQEKVLVVLDSTTPRAIRATLSANPAVFSIHRPKLTQDYPAFLNALYLSLQGHTPWTR